MSSTVNRVIKMSLFFVGLCLVTALVIHRLNQVSGGSATASTPAAEGKPGDIILPQDLQATLDECIKQYQDAEALKARAEKNGLQVLRIALDRAGIQAEHFEDYAYISDCACIRKIDKSAVK